MIGQGMIAAVLNLAGMRAGEIKRHAGTQIGLTLVIVFLTCMAVAFAAALGTFLLAMRIGPVWALAAGLAGTLVALGVAFIVLRVDAKRHRQRQAEARARDKRVLIETALAAIGGVGSKSAVAATLAAVVVGMLVASGGQDDGDNT